MQFLSKASQTFQPRGVQKSHLFSCQTCPLGMFHRVHIGVEMKLGGECICPLSWNVRRKFFLYVMVNRVKGGGRAPTFLTSQGWFFNHDEIYDRMWPCHSVYTLRLCGMYRRTQITQSGNGHCLANTPSWRKNQPGMKPNSWTYNFLEVSGHNLENSQTLLYIANQFQTTFAQGGGGVGGSRGASE